MARLLVPALTVLSCVVYLTIDLLILASNAGAPLTIPDADQWLLAGVVGAIAASLAESAKVPLVRAAITLIVPALLGPLFIVASVALKDKAIVPAVWRLYPTMTFEWALIGLATAVTLWPLFRRRPVETPTSV